MSNKLTGDSAGMSFIISNMKNTMPADQYIREVNKNAEEAIQRVQKINPEYKGQIVFQKDQEYYKKNKVDKLCVIDNGDGMSYNFLTNYMLKLGASLRGNKHKNFGAGFKISALPFNAYGIIVCSWVKNSPGYMLWVHYNDKKDEYEAKMFNKNYVIRLEDSVKPKEITDHGTKITFLGDSKSQNTTLIHPLLLKGGLFKGGRKGQSTWITSFLNTKKYFIEKNIKTTYRDINVQRNVTIIGHYESLQQAALDKGSVTLNKATVDWFLLPHDEKRRSGNHSGSRLTVGQLATVHEDEVLKVDYAGKSDRNPLAAWGHQYSKTRVAFFFKKKIKKFIKKN
jgi:hypothetical protein